MWYMRIPSVYCAPSACLAFRGTGVEGQLRTQNWRPNRAKLTEFLPPPLGARMGLGRPSSLLVLVL
jgi:hypothetical protein